MSEKACQISFNLRAKDVETLTSLARNRGWSMAQVAREPLALLSLFEEAKRAGSNVLIEKADHKLRKVVWK